MMVVVLMLVFRNRVVHTSLEIFFALFFDGRDGGVFGDLAVARRGPARGATPW